MEKRKSWRAEDLDVFTRAYQLSLELHRASLKFPKIEQYSGLADQLRRASKSVCGLIVEGSGRQAASPKEFARYLMMAVGSAEETRLWLRYALDLGYLPSEQAEHWREEVAHVIRMLQGLRASLEARRDPSDH
jgi:four helix bundle protein